MLGSYSRDEIANHQDEGDIEIDLESDRLQQTAYPVSSKRGLVLNTNSRENSDATIETARMINIAITSQITRKLYEVKIDLKTRISAEINSAITEKVLPFI